MMDNSGYSSKLCIHCSVALTQSNEDDLYYQDFTAGAVEIPSDSTSSKQWLMKALSSIFKLNYLTAFDTLKDDNTEDNADQLLCPNCRRILTDLYQLYRDFVQLGSMDSYLSKKLAQLDEIMDSHQQKSINCDLIVANEKRNLDKRDEENRLQTFHGMNQDSLPDKCSSAANDKNHLKLDKSSSFVSDGREARILLTRLPENYSKMTYLMDDNESLANPSSSSIDNIDNYNNVKTEVDEDTVVMQEDDGNFLEESSRSLKSMKQFKSRRKKTAKSSKSSSTKKKAQQRTREQSRRASAKIATITISQMTKDASNLLDENRRNDDQSAKIVKLDKRRKTKDTKSSVVRSRKKNFYDHMKTRNYLAKRARYPNPCWYCCRKDFDTPADCLEHTKKEHLPQMNNPLLSSTHVCERCSRICVGDMSFKFHNKKCQLIPPGVILPKKYPCPECSKLFFSKDEVNTHMIHHSNERPFPCPECPYRAKVLSVLKAHQSNKHSNVEQSGEHNFKCDECGKPQKNDKMLTWHKWAFHTAEGNQKYREQKAMVQVKRKEKRVTATPVSTFCEDCNVDLFARLALINHRRSFHGDNMGKEWVCEICGRDFSRAHSLKSHTERVHSDERPYICELCGKRFKVNYNLKAHVEQTHTEEGRLKYNQRMRESNRRMKLRANQLANVERMQISNESFEVGESSNPS